MGRLCGRRSQKLGLNAAFGSSTDWQTSEGEGPLSPGHLCHLAARWSLIHRWRLSTHPNREVCALRRTRTNTPLQSLVTLNDPVYVEAAQALARRAIEHDSVVEEQIAYAFRCCLLRAAHEDELKPLVALYNDSRTQLADRPKATEKLATVPSRKAAAGHEGFRCGGDDRCRQRAAQSGRDGFETIGPS